jgi:hypothetical protein
VGRQRDDRDGRLAERHLTGPVDDRHAGHPEPRSDLVGDLAEHGQRHRVVRLVLERLDAPAGMACGLGLLTRRGRPGRRPGRATGGIIASSSPSASAVVGSA